MKEKQRHVIAEMMTVAADRRATPPGLSRRGSSATSVGGRESASSGWAVGATGGLAGSTAPPELVASHAEARRQVAELQAELEEAAAAHVVERKRLEGELEEEKLAHRNATDTLRQVGREV